MLRESIERAVPNELKVFPKLTSGRDPYHFDRWTYEGDDAILRYWFWNRDRTRKNKKRVFISEVESFFDNAIKAGQLTRSDYSQFCPRTKSDGDCGFAVIVRLLEHLEAVKIEEDKYLVIAENASTF